MNTQGLVIAVLSIGGLGLRLRMRVWLLFEQILVVGV